MVLEAPFAFPTTGKLLQFSYPEIPDNLQEYAKDLVVHTWGEEEWNSFYTIVDNESSWTHNGNHNLSLSTAFGLGGFLDSTWETVGCVKTYDEYEQIRCIVKYIEQRYSTPREALRFHVQNSWY